MGKIATVYTGASDELLTMVRIALKKELGDNGFELLEYLDPSISDDMSSMGFVPMSAGIRMVDMYQKAVRDGAELIMTCCSSVGNIAKAAKPLYEMMGIRFLRIDEAMAEEAVKSGRRIGLIGTVPTTFAPSTQLIEDTAHRLGKSVDVIPSMPENAFGLAHDAFKAKIKEACNRILDSVDVILLAQASMTSVAAELQKELHIPVFCSIPYAARRVHEMLHV